MHLRYAACLLLALPLAAQEPASTVSVDKAKRSVTIECVVAPRKLPKLDKIYPIEVIATFAAPKGQKAHETVVNFTAKPSEVHKALESLGLKAGKSVLGEGGKPSGAAVEVFLEVPGDDGKTKHIAIEEALIDQGGKAVPKMQWLFTGSEMIAPDPEKDDKVYGADFSGTLLTVFPVTKDTVLQSTLPFKQQESLKLETNSKVLPKVGTKIKLVIQAR